MEAAFGRLHNKGGGAHFVMDPIKLYTYLEINVCLCMSMYSVRIYVEYFDIC